MLRCEHPAPASWSDVPASGCTSRLGPLPPGCPPANPLEIAPPALPLPAEALLVPALGIPLPGGAGSLLQARSALALINDAASRWLSTMPAVHPRQGSLSTCRGFGREGFEHSHFESRTVLNPEKTARSPVVVR